MVGEKPEQAIIGNSTQGGEAVQKNEWVLLLLDGQSEVEEKEYYEAAES